MQVLRVTGIHQLLQKETICVGLPGETKSQVLDGLIQLLAHHPDVLDLKALREAVLKREAVMSTGVGKGLALPHAKTPAVRDTVAALAITSQPIPFGAIDQKPVRILFLLVGTEEAKSQHIKILARISRLMNRDQFREQLLATPDPENVLMLIRSGEEALMEG